MVFNVELTDADAAAALADGSMAHEVTSHSWAMVPGVRARSASAAVVAAGPAGGDRARADGDGAARPALRLGDPVRRGLPLAFVLAYLGAVALERRPALLNLSLTALLTVAVLVVDATTGLDPVTPVVPCTC
jgi:hypothetical protein